MPIPREYATSNPVVRDALAQIPLPQGTRVGDFVAPDYPIDAEIVDTVTTAEHALNLDDLRAPDAQAKEVRFETGSIGTVTIVERALKTKMDSRKIEEAGSRGVNLIAERLDLLRSDILDAKEYRISQLVFAAANYAGTHKDVTGLNFRTIDLFKYVSDWQELIVADGRFPGNRGLIGRKAWNVARQNAEFNKFVAGPSIKGGARDLTLERFAEYLGLQEVRIADFQRKIGATQTQFWDANTFLLFCQQNTLSDRTLAATPVCAYGEAQGAAQGTLVDVRTEPLPGVERLTEAGVFHRYRNSLRNASLGFIVTGIVGT
jgi:hypothetical protein